MSIQFNRWLAKIGIQVTYRPMSELRLRDTLPADFERKEKPFLTGFPFYMLVFTKFHLPELIYLHLNVTSPIGAVEDV